VTPQNRCFSCVSARGREYAPRNTVSWRQTT